MRVGFIAVAIVLAVWALWSRWPQVVAAAGRLDPGYLVGAALATVANLVLTGLAWRALLADLGARLPVGLAARGRSPARSAGGRARSGRAARSRARG